MLSELDVRLEISTEFVCETDSRNRAFINQLHMIYTFVCTYLHIGIAFTFADSTDRLAVISESFSIFGLRLNPKAS